MKLIWTACVPAFMNSDHLLFAQEKSSRAALKRRIEADDPIWTQRKVTFKRMPQFKKALFRRGLAFVCMPALEACQRGYV